MFEYPNVDSFCENSNLRSQRFICQRLFGETRWYFPSDLITQRSHPVFSATKPYYSWNVTNHMRPTISGPDLRYQAPTYNIRPRPTISGPQTKQRFRSCSKRFSPRTASKINEHFDQQNGTKLFFPQLCLIPFTICQVSSKIVEQRRSTLPLRRSY